MAKYADTDGYPVEVEPGEWGGNARHLFMNGQCHALAYAVAERMDWELALITVNDIDNGMVVAEPHVTFVTDDGRLGDADGLHNEDVLFAGYENRDEAEPPFYIDIQYWDDRQALMDYLVESPYEWQRPELELAESMVSAYMREQNLVPVLGDLHAASEAPPFNDGQSPELHQL
jgi:hypothetical protein